MYATASYSDAIEFTRLYDINGKLLAKSTNAEFLYFVIEFIDPLKIFTGSYWGKKQQSLSIQTLDGQLALA